MARDERGLTLIELMVALSVVLVALTVLAGVFVGSLHTLTVAKQRQSATALATRAMEQMRALPFSTLTSGLSTGDLAGDPNITGTPPRFTPAAAPTVDETLQTNTSGGPTPDCTTATTPLLPHRCPTVLDEVTYTVASYVAQVPAVTPVQYSLTTIVTWSSAATRGKTRSIVNRSRAFSPNGTCAPANHPFNTPCQSQFHGSAGLSEGGVTVSGTVDGQTIAPGLDVVQAELSLPRLSSSTSVEQTISVSGATAAHSARLKGATTEQRTGAQALSSANTDPSNTGAGVPTAEATVAGPLSKSGSGWTIDTLPETSGTWSTTSRASAGTNSGCKDATGLAIDATAQPCGSSSNAGTSAAAVVLKPAALAGRLLPAFELARLGTPAASRAFSARFVVNRPTWCPTATGVGCVSAGALRPLGTTVIGHVPAGLVGDAVPTTTGAVRLEGYEARVSAASGTGAAGPAASRTGTLRTWNGAAYTTTDLATTLTAVTLPVSMTATYAGTTAGTTATVRISGTVEVTPPTVTAATCTTGVCSADSGAVVAELTYELLDGAAQAATFRVRADLGALLAKTTFKGV